MTDHGHSAHGPVTRPGETADETLEHAHDDHGHGGVLQYILVFVALCFLTTMSFFTYSEFWPWKEQEEVGRAFMMVVSCTKALLVILFFMHVLWEANWKYVLTIPAAMMALFLGIMLIPDIGFRNRMVSQERAVHMARPSDLETLQRAGAEADGATAH